MSLMKQYAEDSQDLSLRAIEAAWLPDHIERAVSLSALFRDCGTAALVYHSPAEVAAMFVHTVAETYAAEFMAQQEGQAA